MYYRQYRTASSQRRRSVVVRDGHRDLSVGRSSTPQERRAAAPLEQKRLLLHADATQRAHPAPAGRVRGGAVSADEGGGDVQKDRNVDPAEVQKAAKEAEVVERRGGICTKRDVTEGGALAIRIKKPQLALGEHISDLPRHPHSRKNQQIMVKSAAAETLTMEPGKEEQRRSARSISPKGKSGGGKGNASKGGGSKRGNGKCTLDVTMIAIEDAVEKV